MAKIDLNLRASKVVIEHDYSFKGVIVGVEDVYKNEVLDHFTLREVIELCTPESLLDEIGIDRVKEYFNFKDSEEE